jgi:diaminohydroxyphosphoribosylaminopyrimidine deaminase/5-amino-6-(5-phosphoribosylamino)uracil reductase
VDAVLAAGIKKVVVGMKDPNPRTNGKSIRKMRAHGVKVVTGVCALEARDMNLPFIKFITTGMPHVTAKVAQTMDGKAGLRGRQVPWITTPSTRACAGIKRNAFDAIMTGVNTVLWDDPVLDAPDKAIVKVVVDSHLRMPLNAKLLKDTTPGQVIIVTTRKASRVKIAAFEKKGVRVMVAPDKAGHVDLKVMFKELAKNGLSRILIEGGPTLVDAALKAGLVDRLHIYVAPKVMSGFKERDVIAGFDMEALADTKTFRIVQVERMGSDMFMEVVCSQVL